MMSQYALPCQSSGPLLVRIVSQITRVDISVGYNLASWRIINIRSLIPQRVPTVHDERWVEHAY